MTPNDSTSSIPHRPVSIGLLAVIVCLTALLSGCAGTRTLSGDQLTDDNGDALTLYLRDGRRIELPAGRYQVRLDSARSLEGSGRLLGTSLNDLGQRWEGSIRLSEIDSVRTKGDPGWWQASGFLIGVSAVLGACIAFLLAGGARFN